MIAEGNVVARGNAKEGALRCFGWGGKDILDTIRKLRVKHFHKTEPSELKPQVMIDFYLAYGLDGEDIYTHFYIDPTTGKLVINSFKELDT